KRDNGKNAGITGLTSLPGPIDGDVRLALLLRSHPKEDRFCLTSSFRKVLSTEWRKPKPASRGGPSHRMLDIVDDFLQVLAGALR
ncbi:MAG TPA: hypothetical protein VH592_26315, partial [Gemmataceae bacterium]